MNELDPNLLGAAAFEAYERQGSKHPRTWVDLKTDAEKAPWVEAAMAAIKAQRHTGPIQPGARISVLCTLPGLESPMSSNGPVSRSLPAIPKGSCGRVVRLVHLRAEGEPFTDGQPMESTIVHVLFDGADRIRPLGLGLLRSFVPLKAV